jgi:hypothetical protein
MDTETIEEIDEALAHALVTRANAIDSKKQSINDFINDLLDSRLELTNAKHCSNSR